MPELFDQIQEAKQAIQKRWAGKPRVGIILGTGLGGLAQDIAAEATIPFEDIPHFLRSTVTSHAGNFVCGKLAGKIVVAMEGRIHAYEGYSLKQLTFPVRIMKALGCEILIASNACGGMNPQFAKGDLMVIEDHINLMGDNPLIGPNDERLGPRFPDMCHAYDRELIWRLRLLIDLGLVDRRPGPRGVAPRDMLLDCFRRLPPPPEFVDDTDSLAVVVEGEDERGPVVVRHDLTARAQRVPPLSAVARDTGFPPAIVARMILDGTITERGVLPPERCVPAGELLAALARRGMRARRRATRPR